MFLVPNERAKLTASLFNALAASLIAAAYSRRRSHFSMASRDPAGRIHVVGQLALSAVERFTSLGRLTLGGCANESLQFFADGTASRRRCWLAIFWLTGWMDRREQQRHLAVSAPQRQRRCANDPRNRSIRFTYWRRRSWFLPCARCLLAHGLDGPARGTTASGRVSRYRGCANEHLCSSRDA